MHFLAANSAITFYTLSCEYQLSHVVVLKQVKDLTKYHDVCIGINQ